MSDHQCGAIIVTCIDFRFQEYINSWIAQNFAPKTFDRVSWAGGVKDQEGILKQIEISHKLHHIKRVILINHEDCGAYGVESTPKKHAEDLKNSVLKIKILYPDLEVNAYYLLLDGSFKNLF